MPEPSSDAAALVINVHRNIVTAELKGANSILNELLANSSDMVEYGSYAPGDAAMEIDVLEKAIGEGARILKDTIERCRRAGA